MFQLSEDFENFVVTPEGNEVLRMSQLSNRKYGTEIGYIAPEVWNPYAKAHGYEESRYGISVNGAMKLMTTDTVREQSEAKRAEKEELQANSETGQRPEQGI